MNYLLNAGIKARPTGKQVTITISVTGQLKDRIVDAGRQLKRTTTSILTEAVENWLKENDM